MKEYIEVSKVNVPKKYRIEKLSGCAVQNKKYLRSNTSNITYGKYFEKIAEPLNFEPVKREKFEMLEDESIRYNLEKVFDILDSTDNSNLYTIQFEKNDRGLFNLVATRYLEENEIEVQEHDFKDFEKNFIGMYNFKVSIPFTELTLEQVQEIINTFPKHLIKFNLTTLKDVVSKYSLKIERDSNNFHHAFYSKKRSYNFDGRHSEEIDVFKSNLE